MMRKTIMTRLTCSFFNSLMLHKELCRRSLKTSELLVSALEKERELKPSCVWFASWKTLFAHKLVICRPMQKKQCSRLYVSVCLCVCMLHPGDGRGLQMLPAADFVTDFACGNRDTSPLLLEPLFGDRGSDNTPISYVYLMRVGYSLCRT